jgi:para-aminobenzoate synthetase component I
MNNGYSHLDPLSALSVVADAPVIVCLIGSQGASLAWDDDAQAACPVMTTIPEGASLMPSAEDTCEPTWGQTWGPVPASATFVQLDYEFPATKPRLLKPRHLVQWDTKGVCHIMTANADEAQQTRQRLEHATQHLPAVSFTTPLCGQWSEGEYASRVSRIREWIAAGDCYQANLAMPFTATLARGPQRDVALFKQLVTGSSAPFAGFFRSPGRPSVVSHSPECFIAQRGRQLVSVPIKGTRRRILGRENEIRDELAHAPKDAAELAMIVDLVRNDLGRVSVPGSVQVTNRGHFIDLTHVHHRASRIEATLAPNRHLRDVVTAAFPAGSITGAPKLRAMQILGELEGNPRGAYCGAFGWMNGNSADLAVAIRTASLEQNQLTFHAGGGIVWDSEAHAEWAEIHAKAAGFAHAVGAWA